MEELGSNSMDLELSNADHLGQVLDLLLDPEKKVVDDTSLQRLLEYCKEMFSHNDDQLQTKLQPVHSFMEACCARETGTFDPCALTFAFQLLKCLPQNAGVYPPAPASTDMEGSAVALAVRLLQRASKEKFFSDPCMKEAWLTALDVMADSDSFAAVCKATDAVSIGTNLLGDTSMFVVKAAQRFLAKVLLKHYRPKADRDRDNIQAHEKCQSSRADNGSVSRKEDGSTFETEDGNTRNKDTDDVRPVVVTQDESLPKEEHRDGETETTYGSEKRRLPYPANDGTVVKKARIGDGAGNSGGDVMREIEELSASVMMSRDAAAALTHLLMEMESGIAEKQAVVPSALVCKHQEKPILSLGVFRCLLDSASSGGAHCPGFSLLDDVSMVMTCKRLLLKDGPITERMAFDMTDFMGRIMLKESERCDSVEASHLHGVQDVPYELLERGLIRPAIRLAASLIRCHSVMEKRFPGEVTSVNAALSVLLTPISIMMGDHGVVPPIEPKLAEAGKRAIASGQQPLHLICASLSSLHGLATEDAVPIGSLDVFHMAVSLLQAFVVGPWTSSQSEGLLAAHRSLIGSRRILLVLLDLAQTSLNVNSLCDARSLLDVLTTILQDPDAERKVIMKSLDITPWLLPVCLTPDPIHPTAHTGPHEGSSTLSDFGSALQKKVCNIEWEIRDSAITSIWKLLQGSSDVVRGWVKSHNLHKRLWESLVDGESYVRSTSLQALPVLMKCKALWDDVMTSAGLTPVDVVSQVVDIIKTDSEAFSRRSAIDVFLVWLRDEEWMQESVQAYITMEMRRTASADGGIQGGGSDCEEGHKIETSGGKGPTRETPRVALGQEQSGCHDNSGRSGEKDVEFSTQNGLSSQSLPTVAETSGNSLTSGEIGKSSKEVEMMLGMLAMNAVDLAANDFDWEIKNRALTIVELLLSWYIPGFQVAEAAPGSTNAKESASASRRGRTLQLPGESKAEASLRFLSQTQFLKVLLRVQADEDVSVSRQACLMLQHLKETLQALSPTDDVSLATNGSINAGMKRKANGIGCAEVDGGGDGSHSPSDVDDDGDDEGQTRSALIGRVVEGDWMAVLRTREADHVEGPVSLMMDIVAAAHDKDENLLDCY